MSKKLFLILCQMTLAKKYNHPPFIIEGRPENQYNWYQVLAFSSQA